MKTTLIAMTCVLGIAACGRSDAPPPNDPASLDTTAAFSETTAQPVVSSSSNSVTGGTRATVSTPATATTPEPIVSKALPPADAAVVNNPGVADQTKDATNTKINDRDRHGALTPMDQGASAAERNITASIRKAVVADKSLSFTAKNVKIITTGTKVTLRGPVKNDQERTAIETRAKQTAGVTEVDNQLEIKN